MGRAYVVAGWIIALLLTPMGGGESDVPGERGIQGERGVQGEWDVAEPDYDWDFPKDHWPHERFKTEWWYFTGLLSESSGGEPTLGYQFTVFKIGVVPNVPASESEWATADVFMGHLAVTDLESGAHRFSEVLNRAAPPLAGFAGPDTALIAWSLAPPGTDGRWELSATDTGFHFRGVDGDLRLDLTTDTASAVVFQGPGGYSRKADAPGRASMYYSYTDLTTRGTISMEGRSRQVRGTSWMDHEFSSNPLDDAQVGWDWFSLRLADGRALMAFQLRDQSGESSFEHLSLIEQDGSVRYLANDEWTLASGDTWISPDTQAEYPLSWRLTLPGEGLDLVVQAVVQAQENVSQRVDNLFYWEGAVTVQALSGARSGEGYLEMTGYGDGSRPAL